MHNNIHGHLKFISHPGTHDCEADTCRQIYKFNWFVELSRKRRYDRKVDVCRQRTADNQRKIRTGDSIASIKQGSNLNSPANAVKVTITHFSDLEKILYGSTLSFDETVAFGTDSVGKSCVGELASAAGFEGDSDDMC